MSWLSKLFSRHPVNEPFSEASGTAHFAQADTADAQHKALPRFKGTAGDKVRPGGNSRVDQIRFRLRSAFTPSRPVVTPTMFAGRTALLRKLIRSIEDQHMHVVLFGARGIGKTSTLHILCRIAREARYVVRYSSCGEETQFDELFRAILDDIPLLFHANYEPTADEIEEGLTFASLIGDAPLTVTLVSDILSKVSGTRVLIVLDEFDRASSANFRRMIAELIKNLSDRASRVQIVIAGVASNLNEIIEQIPSIRRNILGLPLPIMDQEEVVELIRNGENASGLVFAEPAVQTICKVAHGLPYLAGLISQHAGIAALDRRQTVVAIADVITGVLQACEEIELQISPNTLHKVKRARDAGYQEMLDLLARQAIVSGGRLMPGGENELTGEKMPGLDRLAPLLGEYDILRAIPKDPADALMFSDEGLPVYLWLQQCRMQFEAPVQGGRVAKPRN
ncbi:ATP-binding protein [Sphingomonas sp. FW199]|uniref:ATP-binding protein n=1 Tax=Sphingomonas sp. FW199 TaxID=3400217 RepID=UPI003CF613C1